MRALPVAAAATLLLGAAGCTDDDEPRSTPTTTRPSTTTTTTEAELSDEEQIEALEREWFEATQQIHRRERDVEDAAEFIDGEYLSRYRADFAEYLASGFSGRESEQSDVVIETVNVDGESAEVRICTVDADTKIIEATGEVVDDDVYVVRYTDSLTSGADGWRISYRSEGDPVEGATACPED